MELGIRIHIDTERGTRLGVPALTALLGRNEIPATFLFSLGPDRTGRAITRIFRKGFLKKVIRSNVAGNYGLRTLLNGTLLPAPHVGRRHADLIRSVEKDGFEVGIHCYDHYTWQDHLKDMDAERVREEFGRARAEFERIFGRPALTADTPGWQTNAHSLRAYDEANLLYSSDARGTVPFFPTVNGEKFKTLQLPTTLPTLDELLGRPEYPEGCIAEHYLDLIRKSEAPSVLTIHAELEGLRYANFFEDFLRRAKRAGVKFYRMQDRAQEIMAHPEKVPYCELVAGYVDGRSAPIALCKAGEAEK